MQSAERFKPGAPIILREAVHSKVWTVRPVRVVEDTPEIIALYMAPGTIYKHPRTLEGDQIPRHLLTDDWRLIDREWFGGGALYLGRIEDPYMVVGFRNDDNTRFESWYINLQDPLTRTKLGFDYLDMELDIEVNADLTQWHWKDEEKFNELVEKGIIPQDKADNLRQVGAQVTKQIIKGDSVIKRWQSWQPSQDWTIPPIPMGWDNITR